MTTDVTARSFNSTFISQLNANFSALDAAVDIATGSVASLASLKALSGTDLTGIVTTQYRTAAGDGGGGTWAWRSGDQSANVTADTTGEGWAAPTSAPTGASGAWQKQTYSASVGFPHDSDIATGYFATYDCRASILHTLTQGIAQDLNESGGIRSALALYHYDQDNKNYSTSSYQTISEGLTVGVFGQGGTSGYSATYKDLIAIRADAIGQIEWVPRGVSSISGSAIQLGSGIALNELWVSNPSYSVNQSAQMAAIYGVLSGKKAAADASHTVHGVMIVNVGKLATAAFEAYTGGTDGDSGTFGYLLRGDRATVESAAITMPASATGNAGTVISYDPNDYSFYDRAGNIFSWVIGGSSILTVGSAAVTANIDLSVTKNVNGNATINLTNSSTGASSRAIVYMTTGTNRQVTNLVDYTGQFQLIGGTNVTTRYVDFNNQIFRNNASTTMADLNATRLLLGSGSFLEAPGGLKTGLTSALVTSTVAMTNGAAANTGTLTNAPVAGNPTKWIPINDNGTTRYIPAW